MRLRRGRYAARAQRPGKLPTIGYLGGGGSINQRAWVDAFVQRLRELGWIEGRTVAIEIGGQKDVASARLRLPPNSTGAILMSL